MRAATSAAKLRRASADHWVTAVGGCGLDRTRPWGTATVRRRYSVAPEACASAAGDMRRSRPRTAMPGLQPCRSCRGRTQRSRGAERKRRERSPSPHSHARGREPGPPVPACRSSECVVRACAVGLPAVRDDGAWRRRAAKPPRTARRKRTPLWPHAHAPRPDPSSRPGPIGGEIAVRPRPSEPPRRHALLRRVGRERPARAWWRRWLRDVELVSPLSANGACIRGRDDRDAPGGAIYSSLRGLHWDPPGLERFTRLRGRVLPGGGAAGRRRDDLRARPRRRASSGFAPTCGRGSARRCWRSS